MRSLFAAILSVALAGCVTAADNAALPESVYDQNRIKAHMAFLADDSMKGRAPFEPEYQLAANYVASQFAQAGLAPADDEGTFFQKAPFKDISIWHSKAEGVVNTVVNGITTSEKEVFAFQSLRVPNKSVSGGLVFVGYGLDIPSKGIDDYEGLDVDGKVVVIASDLPGGLNYDERTFHRSAGRYRAADERGAVGVIWLSLPRRYEAASEKSKRALVEDSLAAEDISTPYDDLSEDEKRQLFETRVQTMERARAESKTPRRITRWVTPDGERLDLYPNLKGAFSLQQGALEEVFALSGMSYDDIIDNMADRKPLKGTVLKAAVSLTPYTEYSDLKYSPNVVGVLPGSDPVLKDEYVVVTGHLDHLGVRGDDIMNGAIDNASGIAVMIEVAQALKDAGVKPRRSILFVAVTAEEMGLQGAYYFVNFPVVDQNSIVANINVDMPLITYDFAEIVGFGAEHSSLGPILERAAKTVGAELAPDPMPEMNIFTRSDHYAFVQQGIPAIFPILGFGAVDEGVDGGEIFNAFMSEGYHRSTDDLSREIRYDVGAKFARVIAETLIETANGPRPRWNEGNFYKETYCGEQC